MNIDDIKSDLVMSDFHFSEMMCKHSAEVTDHKLQVDINKDICKISEHKYNVTVTLSINGTDLRLLVKASAVFLNTSDDDINEDKLMNTSTIAIMFPYIRSQVSLLTTQPGMTPIVLPPIDTSKI